MCLSIFNKPEDFIFLFRLPVSSKKQAPDFHDGQAIVKSRELVFTSVCFYRRRAKPAPAVRIHLITVRQNVPGKRGARGEKSGPRNSERFLPSQTYAARPVPVPLTVKEKSTFRKPRKAAQARYPSPAVRSPENPLPPSRASALLPTYKSAQPVPVL